MGMKMFVASGTFNPSDYGLKVGDVLNIICVGGGQGGQCGGSGGTVYTGGTGATSSFGSIVSAIGGGDTTGQYINTDNSCYGGCGGFILGCSDWGGMSMSVEASSSTPSTPSPGSAGAKRLYHARNRYEGISYGGGSGGYGAGGGGYGAGGGSTYYQATAKGGSSGKVEYATHKLANLNNISVSVGGGGSGGYYAGNGNNGSISGGGAPWGDYGGGGYNNIGGGQGSSICGGGGAGGVVIVFW